MRSFLILPCILAVATAQSPFGSFFSNPPKLPIGELPNFNPLQNITSLDDVQGLKDFVTLTGKTYANAAEETFRQGIFTGKKTIVDANNEAFNLGQKTFKLGINIFSDLSNTEFLSKLCGYKKSSVGDAKVQAHRQKAPEVRANIPESFDWREKGGVTPVKFQGLGCNSCWSFAVTGAVEGHHFRKTQSLVPLSEQNLIDCSSDFGNTGCDGGYQEYGFSYVIENRGLAKSDKYPYAMKGGKCNYNPNIKGAGMKAFAVIEPGNVEKMKEVIATLGPLACSVNAGADSFQLYKEGIYNDDECNKGEVNHAIVVVGYDKDSWIVKNSWSDKWGEGGYMLLSQKNNGSCGVTSECSYPIL